MQKQVQQDKKNKVACEDDEAGFLLSVCCSCQGGNQYLSN